MEQDTLKFSYQVMRELLGPNLTPVTLFVSYIFALAALFLRWYWRYMKIGKKSHRTPRKFKLGFWVRDNLMPRLLGMIATVIVIFFSIKFADKIGGEVGSYFWAVLVGLGFDVIMDFWKNQQPHVKAAEKAGLPLE